MIGTAKRLVWRLLRIYTPKQSELTEGLEVKNESQIY